MNKLIFGFIVLGLVLCGFYFAWLSKPEVFQSASNENADTDGDGFSDGEEKLRATDPKSRDSKPAPAADDASLAPKRSRIDATPRRGILCCH